MVLRLRPKPAPRATNRCRTEDVGIRARRSRPMEFRLRPYSIPSNQYEINIRKICMGRDPTPETNKIRAPKEEYTCRSLLNNLKSKTYSKNHSLENYYTFLLELPNLSALGESKGFFFTSTFRSLSSIEPTQFIVQG
ncbi:uncharacterized protein G2W53_026664 [Senna tora]|uniref:Uncharacterized protein n=1 Tax=Senna tora TaxID=362788 RepID=A0A834WLI5_9FABA|nr:uncharacterized protein G2W53_026664 [Senna tora]